MGGLDSGLVDAILGHQLDLLRLEAGTRARIIRLLNQLQLELTTKLNSGGVLTNYTKARLQALLRQSTETIDSYYLRMQGDLELTLRGVADIQVTHISGSLASTLTISAGANIPTETFMARLVSNVLIHGAPSSVWWERQSADVAFKFANAVRQGMVQGQTNDEIVARVVGNPTEGIAGLMSVTKANVKSLVHSSIQTVANAARMQTFRENSDIVVGVRQLSTFDSHTTDICIAYDGGQWNMEREPIGKTVLPFVNDGGSVDGTPRHWNCRSVMVPITKTFRELGIDIDELPSGGRAVAGGPISSRVTMSEWLSGRTENQLDDQLGAGRAALWRDGKLTLEQLLTLSGNPLTLDQLKARYE